MFVVTVVLLLTAVTSCRLQESDLILYLCSFRTPAWNFYQSPYHLTRRVEHVGFRAGRGSDPQLGGVPTTTLSRCLTPSRWSAPWLLAGVTWVTGVRRLSPWSPRPACAKQFGRRSVFLPSWFKAQNTTCVPLSVYLPAYLPLSLSVGFKAGLKDLGLPIITYFTWVSHAGFIVCLLRG